MNLLRRIALRLLNLKPLVGEDDDVNTVIRVLKTGICQEQGCSGEVSRDVVSEDRMTYGCVECGHKYEITSLEEVS